MNGYFVNIASTIGEPVDEEAQLLSGHKLCEWANDKHKAHQSIIAIKSQLAQNPQHGDIHGFTLSNVSPFNMEKIMQNLNTKKATGL